MAAESSRGNVEGVAGAAPGAVAAAAPDGAPGAAPDSAPGAEPQAGPGAGLFPLRLLGMGLFFTWDWCLSTDGTLFSGVPLVSNAFVAAAVQAVALVALALLSGRLGALSRHPRLLACACAAGAAGQAGALAAAAAGIGGAGLLAAVLACGAATGLSAGVLFLAWAEAYSRLGAGRVVLFGALSLVLGSACFALIEQSSQAVRLGATVAVPLISYACCALSLRYLGGERTEGHTGVRYTFPWKPVLMMGVCGFVAAFVDVALFRQGTLPHHLADLAVGVALVLVAAVLRLGVKPVALVGASLACAAAGIASVAVLGARAAFAASLLTMLSYVLVSFFTFSLLADVCHRRDVPSLWLFGFAGAARIVAERLGGFSRDALPWIGGAADSRLDLALMAVAGLVMIGVVALMWASERSFNSDWAIRAMDAGAGRRRPSEHERLLDGGRALAREAGLTQREAEIFEMLLEGMTYQQVCSSLLLSQNTVKTHARHAYAKLGVHSRDEAARLALGRGEG